MNTFRILALMFVVVMESAAQAQQSLTTELPKGWGNSTTGTFAFQHKCVSCHGGEWGGRTAAASTGLCFVDPVRMFHYVKHAMPPEAPGSLKDTDVYGLVAYVLDAKGIIKRSDIMNAQTLPKVVIPTNGVISSACPVAAGGLGKYESMKDGRKTMPALLPASAAAAPPRPAAVAPKPSRTATKPST